MELVYGELSTAGLVRSNNEDFIGFWESPTLDDKRARGALVALADGVGGQCGGEIASRLAVETALKQFQEAPADSVPTQLVSQIFQAANRAVHERGLQEPQARRMATTLAIAVLRHNRITVGNVGDSRVYLVRRSGIKQISTDHSYAALQREFGLISEEDAKRSETRSILTRSVGPEPLLRVDVEEITAEAGDRLVLCSDGLHGVVTDAEMADIVSRFAPGPACRELVALAEQRKSKDNISVQVLQINMVEKAALAQADLQPGQLLDGRFLIHEVINRSDSETIYKATDQVSHQTVALKVPHLQSANDRGFLSRFQREEELGLRLNHPATLKFIDVGQKSRPYIVTEYLRGYTLSHLLNQVRPMPVAVALKLASHVCAALHYLHGLGLTHGALKPQSIMLCYDDTIRLMDFGIVQGGKGRQPGYLAPEQVKGKPVDARADLYSLGAILYEMLTGRTPFEGESLRMLMAARLIGDPAAPRKLNPQLPPEIEELVLHAMERDAANRYESAAAMQAELDNPASVQVTGRAQRLQAPSKWKLFVAAQLFRGV